MLLPVFTVGTFLSFRKKGYNFVEHLVINAFLTGQRLVIRIVLFPIFYFLSGENLKAFSMFVNLIFFVLAFWAFVQIFNTLKKSTVFLRMLLSLLISGLIFMALSLTGFLIAFSE